MLSLIQQLEAANRPPARVTDGLPLADSAVRHQDRGEKFCSYHKKYEPIDQFPLRVQDGKTYYESYCKEAKRLRSKAKRITNGTMPLLQVDLLAKLNICKKRLDALLAGKPAPAMKRIQWKLENSTAMLSVLPAEFTRDTAAHIWCMTTKVATARYIQAMLAEGLIVEHTRANRKAPQVYRKQER